MIRLDGKDMELKYGVNAIRAILRTTGKTPDEVFNRFDPRDLEFGTIVIWAGLLWQNRRLTPEQVGEWLDQEEGLYLAVFSDAIDTMLGAFGRTFGVKAEAIEEETEKN